MNMTSKLPDVGITIFSVMTNLANESGAINLSQGFPDFFAAIFLVFSPTPNQAWGLLTGKNGLQT
jgi:methionine aminotransferase